MKQRLLDIPLVSLTKNRAHPEAGQVDRVNQITGDGAMRAYSDAGMTINQRV